MSDIQGASAKGRQLYHQIWSAVRDNFVDRQRLSDWSSWEHRFDDSITDEANALPFAQEMVRSLGEKFTFVELNDTSRVPVKQAEPKQPTATDGQCFSRRLGNIGYLCIWSFDAEGVADEVAQEAAKLANCQGIILDLRGNGGGNIEEAVAASETFIEEGFVTTVERIRDGQEQKRVSFLLPEGAGVLITGANGEEEMLKARRRSPVLAGKPTVILIDYGTGSAAEIFAAALLENPAQNSCAIGQTTRGKGIAQTRIQLAPGVVVSITCGRFYSPELHWFGDAGQTVAAGIQPQTVLLLDGWGEGMTAATRLLNEKMLKPR